MLNLNGIQSPSNSSEFKHTKVLILGSGPAGLSAALYAARAELSPLVLTGTDLGGQAALTYTIENYPGFPDGVGGAELGELFQKQAEKFGAEISFDNAQSVDLSKRPFTVVGDNGTYTADTLIIASGARPNHLQIPGESEMVGRGVSYCATCDGAFFKDRRVVVVGGGDSAIEEGLFLTRYASNVTVVHRRDAQRAGAVLQERAFGNPKMNFIWNSVVTEVVGDGKTEAVKLKNVQSGKEETLPMEGVFIFIGHTPNTEVFKGQLEMQNGYIKVDERMHTSVPGVFAAGEVADPHFRQVITSAGMGAAAAIEATYFLQNES